MFWGLITKPRGRSKERVQPQMLNENIQAAARRIDAYYDSQLYEGMLMDDAIRIEQQRAAAHADLTRRALAVELDGWQRPGRM